MDIFEQAFGGGSRRARGPRRGSDVQQALRLEFLEAVNGCTKDIRTEYIDLSDDDKRVRRNRNVNVTIPAGVDSGVVLRVSEKGNTGDKGMPSGDLLLHLDVKSDSYFRRNNYDVHTEIPISVSQAILGATIDVLTLDGMVEMKVPSGTQPDSQLAMRGKGIRRVNGTRRGAQIVHLKLVIPKSINSTQKELLEKYQEEENKSSSSSGGGINSSVLLERAWERLKKYMGSDDKKTGTN